MNGPSEISILQAEDSKIPIDVRLIGDSTRKKTGAKK